MGARAAKHSRADNESKRRKPKVRIYAARKSEENQRLLNGTDEQNNVLSRSTLYDLPLEMLDIILQKSYMHWVLYSSAKQRDEEVISSLISVDVCFNRRITRQRFKKTIWRYLKDFYDRTKKRSAIIRNNQSYLSRYIEPNDEFIDSLFSLNCITEKQSHFIQQQHSTRDKNAELLRFLRSLDGKMLSNFVKCLRRTNQMTAARIIENGGVVIKVKVQTCGTTSMYPRLLHQGISNSRNGTKLRSDQTDKLISQLIEKGIEILNSLMLRKSVIVWIWCHSQSAVEYIQKLYKSNHLKNVLSGFANIQPSTSEIIQSKVINIESNQFKKTVVVRPISVNFTERIEVDSNERVLGVTKLRNEIYILCRPHSSTNLIHVFEDRNPFHLQMKIEIKEIKSSVDIGSSEEENCLYVCDSIENCVWKVTREAGDQHKIIKWLTIDYEPLTLSVSNAGHLLMVSGSSSMLMIYGSDAELIRAVKLPGDIEYPRHAVETSIGNFIIIHDWMKRWKIESRSSERKWGVSEVTRDGQMVIRRFISSNETQQLKNPEYLSLDSDDRVFVADYGNDRVILLDCDLRWNRILCPTREEDEVEEEEAEKRLMRMPWSLYFDEEKKQLIVGGYLNLGQGIKIYTFSRQ